MVPKLLIQHKPNSFKFRAADFLKIGFDFISILVLTFAISEIAFAQEGTYDPSNPYGISENDAEMYKQLESVCSKFVGNELFPAASYLGSNLDGKCDAEYKTNIYQPVRLEASELSISFFLIWTVRYPDTPPEQFINSIDKKIAAGVKNNIRLGEERWSVPDTRGDRWWHKFQEVPIGDYATLYIKLDDVDGVSQTHRAEVEFDFRVKGCSASFSAYLDQEKKLRDDYTYEDKFKYEDPVGVLTEFANRRVKEIARVLGTEPFCQVISVNGSSEEYSAKENDNLPIEAEGVPEEPEEVEALVEHAPTDEDLPIKQSPDSPTEDWGEVVVERLTGGALLLLPGADPNADDSWREVKAGDVIPYGAKLFTSYASEATLHFSNGLVTVVLALTEVTIGKPETYFQGGLLKLGTGDVRFKVHQGDFRTDMKVSTPQLIAGVVGTDFAIGYDKEAQKSFVEIYDGSVKMTNIASGEERTISSSYGDPIKRLETYTDGKMVEQIAIPKDEWRARQMEQQQVTSSTNSFLWVLFILLIAAGYFAYRKKEKISSILSGKKQR